ncbi:MAG: GntR family transcriptional regulator [Eubacterium sp.]
MKKNIKYIEIAQMIKSNIRSTVMKPGEMLPSENQMVEEYEVSRVTIRKAIKRLVDEKYLFTVPGKGTFINAYNKDLYTLSLGFDHILPVGYNNTVLIGSKIMKPDIDMVYNLQVSPKEKIINIDWLLKINETPIIYDRKYIPFSPALPISEMDLNYSSIKKILASKFNLYDLKEQTTIHCLCPDDKICRHLGLLPAENPMVFLFDSYVYDEDENPIGWSQIYIKNSYCKLEAYEKS